MRLTERQQRIFRLVLEGHIASGQPIGSAWVVDQLSEDVSAATVRNELVLLEQAGLLRAPHISAGRVPTEDGYRLYIETFVQPSRVEREVKRVEHEIADAHTPEEKVRAIARELSQLAGNVVMVGIDPRSMYSVGMGHMYNAQESGDVNVMRHISAALDSADDLMDELFEVAQTGDVKILIGKQNPIDENLSLMVTTYESSEGARIMALLGFMRMRYDRNIALMQAMKRLLES